MIELIIDYFKILCGVILIMLIFLGLSGIAMHFAQKEACKQRSIGFTEHKYGSYSGCMVKYKGRWLPLSNIRVFGEE